MGPGGLIDALVQLPQFLNNDTPQTQAFQTGGAAGASFLNLRGIGSARTLMLLDGRRIVPTTRSGAADVALLPKALLRRVEVVTGGASAAYGSDAVGGVVNFLLDTHSNGLELRGQGGVSQRGDAANAEWAMTWTGPIGAQSHLAVAAEWSRTDGIRGYADRDWFESWAVVPNTDPAGPLERTVRGARATGYTYGGLITGGPLAGTQFLAGGVPEAFVRGTYFTPTAQVGGSGVDPGRDLVWIQPDQRRASGFAKFSTGWDGGATTFGQLLLGYSNNHFEKDPSSQWGVWSATIEADNAFLPAATRTAMRAAGIERFPLARMSPDLGASGADNRSVLASATVGFEAPIDRGFELEGYYQFGRNHAELQYEGAVRVDRIYRALDAVIDPRSGAIVCRSTLTFPDDGCVPANPFGPGSIGAAARAWLTEGGSEQDQRLTQHVGELKAQGPVANLPAGTATLAVGTAWRHEAVSNRPTRWPDRLNGLTVRAADLDGYRGLPAVYVDSPNIFERTAGSTVTGSYAVWELFAEGAVPLARDAQAGRRLDLNTAARYASYTGSGGTTAWKAGLDWQLEPWVRLRATRSRDIRAGTLSERFDSSPLGSVIVDRSLAGSPSYAVIALRGGNADIEPEGANTLTFGAVLQPAGVPGAALSLDYFDIRVHNAIVSPGAQASIDGCRDGSAAYCDLITRSPTSGLITHVDTSFLNVAEARTRGVDAELSLRRRVTWFGGSEAVALRILATRTLEMSTTQLDAVPIDRAGQTGLPGGAPRWQANASLAFEHGPLQLTVQQRLISAGTLDATYGSGRIDDNRVGGAAYTNLRGSWRFDREPYSLLLFANVVNVFDRDPPLAPGWGFVGSWHTNEGLFDVIGRRYTLGLRLQR